MKTLALRTRSLNVSAGSSSSSSTSWCPPPRSARDIQAFRPVFISSPSAKRSRKSRLTIA